MIPGRVVFSHDDAVVKIYEQNTDGTRGDCLTDGLLYVQDISLIESPRIETYPRLFAGRNRRLTLDNDIELSIGKYHYDKILDWDFAVDSEYWIELVFTDYYILSTNLPTYIPEIIHSTLSAKWNELHIKWDQCHLLWHGRTTAPQTEMFTLKYCTPAGRTLTTKDINEISRKWNVGVIA